MAVVLLLLNTQSMAQALLTTGNELGATSPEAQFIEPEVEPGVPLENDRGHVTFRWNVLPGDASQATTYAYELERAPTGDFDAPIRHYHGTDTASFVSGLEEGRHYFRVRASTSDGEAGPWSESLIVEVNYVSMGKVKLLMLAGALCLIATVAIILVGSFRTKYQSTPPH